MARKLAIPLKDVQRELHEPPAGRRLLGPAPWQTDAPVAPSGKSWLLAVLAALALLAAGAGIFAATLRFEFLDWDDTRYILENPWIRSFSAENLFYIFTSPYYNNYLPLHLLSYQLDYFLWAENPLGYHLQSVLLHALNGVLVYLVIQQLSGRIWVAFLTALFFALHPCHVESVAWVSSRKDVLSMAFALLSLYTYLRSRGTSRYNGLTYVASVFFYMMAILSKAIVVLLPVFFILVDMMEAAPPWRDRQAPFWRLIRNKIPYFALGLAVVYLNYLAQVTAKAAYASDPVQYILVKGHAVWSYFWLLTGAAVRRPIHDLPTLGIMTPDTLSALMGIVLPVTIIWVAYRLRSRVLALGLGWMFVTLFPALAFPLVTYMADRYLYAPSLGFCWLLSAAVVQGASRLAPERTKILCIVGTAVAVNSFFVFRTLQYLPVWKNPESLWRYTVQTSRGFRSRNALAVVYIRQGKYEEAERLLKIAETIPNVTTYRNYGILFDKQGRYKEALEAYERAIALYNKNPGTQLELANIHFNRGVVFWKMRDFVKASEAFEEVLRIMPHHMKAKKWAEKARKRQTGSTS
jgi:hypothetical protein